MPRRRGRGRGKGSKKRSKPTSSSEESPPKEYVATGQSKVSEQSDEAAAKPDSSLASDKFATPDLSSSKVSPSKLEGIASQQRESRTGIVRKLTDDQISEVGVRIFRRWAWLRQKLRSKPDSVLKKSKVTTEEPPHEEEKSIAVENSGLPNMVNLINEEIESLEQVRLEVEGERDEELKKRDPDEKADEAWERYRFKKEAFTRHKAIQSLVISFRESVEMMNRLTASMSAMQLMIRGSPIAEVAAAEPHPELDTFFHDLQQTRDRLNSQSSDDSLLQEKSCSSRESMVTHAPQSPIKSPPPDKDESTLL